MVRGDQLALIIPQGPCHPGKMGSFDSLIVKRSRARLSWLRIAGR
jgi:hypothetical protein